MLTWLADKKQIASDKFIAKFTRIHIEKAVLSGFLCIFSVKY